MKKKILALGLCVAMLAIAVIGGSLAYFTDTEKATNTMVIGNVAINIEEWKYTSNGWDDYVDEEFVLYPLESEQGISLYNKSVRTYNTSEAYKDPVYIRSFVLIEKNDYLPDTHVNEGGTDCCFPGIHFAYDAVANGAEMTYTSSKDSKDQYRSKEAGTLADTVTVNGNEYWVVWYVVADEKTPIPYDAALSSLHSVYMDKNITQDQLVGWGNDGVQVIAFSQAIQSTGLTHAEAMEALGEVTVENLETWVADADVAVINDYGKKAE